MRTVARERRRARWPVSVALAALVAAAPARVGRARGRGRSRSARTPKKTPKNPQALITDLVLRDQVSRSQCAPPERARAAASDKKKGPTGVLGKLWGNGKGKFRTTGKYSSATVRGTIWLTQDQCNGTLTRVRRGVVIVRDFERKKTLNVKAGHSYLARAVKRR